VTVGIGRASFRGDRTDPERGKAPGLLLPEGFFLSLARVLVCVVLPVHHAKSDDYAQNDDPDPQTVDAAFSDRRLSFADRYVVIAFHEVLLVSDDAGGGLSVPGGIGKSPLGFS
jgi:hypothetical protein